MPGRNTSHVSRLTAGFDHDGKAILYFDAADNIPYGQTVEVMDIAKASGAKGIAMLTEKVAK